MNEWMRKSETW